MRDSGKRLPDLRTLRQGWLTLATAWPIAANARPDLPESPTVRRSLPRMATVWPIRANARRGLPGSRTVRRGWLALATVWPIRANARPGLLDLRTLRRGWLALATVWPIRANACWVCPQRGYSQQIRARVPAPFAITANPSPRSRTVRDHSKPEYPNKPKRRPLKALVVGSTQKLGSQKRRTLLHPINALKLD